MALSELTQIKNLLEELTLGTYIPKRFVPVMKTYVPAGNVVTIGNDLVNAQLMGIYAYDSAGVSINGAALWALISSITGVNSNEEEYFYAAIKSSLPFTEASKIQFFVISQASNNIAINLSGGHGVSQIRIIYLPPQYLVNP